MIWLTFAAESFARSGCSPNQICLYHLLKPFGAMSNRRLQSNRALRPGVLRVGFVEREESRASVATGLFQHHPEKWRLDGLCGQILGGSW